MKYIVLTALILLALLLSGCTQKEYVCSDGTSVDSLEKCPVPDTTNENSGDTIEPDPPPSDSGTPPSDPPSQETGYKIVNENFFCELSHYSSSFGVELYNRGTENVQENSVIKLILENDDSTYDYVRDDVEPGKRFWQSMRSSQPGFRGRVFVLNTGTVGEELILDYWLVYCEPGTRPIDCDLSTGEEIQTGSTADCNTEGYWAN